MIHTNIVYILFIRIIENIVTKLRSKKATFIVVSFLQQTDAILSVFYNAFEFDYLGIQSDQQLFFPCSYTNNIQTT